MHTCHATDCKVRTAPEMFMCRRHWFSLPKRLRDAVWRTYRAGQCDDWEISSAYADAASEAVRFVAAKEGKDADVSVYDLLRPKGEESDRP